MEESFKRALRLEYFTVIYNFFEAIASILAGGIANSVALIGFGLDSIVESLSGFVLIWRLKKHGRISREEEERVEKRASRFVGITFFVLGCYVLFESIRKIVLRDIAEPSILGIIIAVISIIVMPVLGYRKLRLGRQLGLSSLVADSKETFVCAFLSVALFVGLTTRYLFDFWLSDPIVGLIIVVFLFKEGFELVRGEEE
jgi:divalent metal cation (Fe/Co/Zn/Cd) transporter